MATTVALPVLRTLEAGEVRAIKARTAASGLKQGFLRAIVGSMSEQEVAALERRIHGAAEGADDGPR